MTDRFATFTAPNSYWQASRAPRFSLLFALPLLAFYQILAVLLSTGPRSIRNGADAILQGLFVAVAGRWGPLLFMIFLIGGGLVVGAPCHPAPRLPPPGPGFPGVAPPGAPPRARVLD